MTLNLKRCCYCHQELPVSEFWKNRTSPDGLQAYCKTCSKVKHTQYRKEKPEVHRACNRRSWQKHRDEKLRREKIRVDKRQEFLDSLKQPCVKCGESRPWVIQFHHIDPTKKVFEVGNSANHHKSKEDIVEESKKCVCLCANCHKEFHYLYGLKPLNPISDLEMYLNGRLEYEQVVQGVRANLSEAQHNVIQG